MRLKSPENKAFQTFWHEFVVDECPDEKRERIRRERLNRIMLGVVALEALRLLEIEKRARAVNE